MSSRQGNSYRQQAPAPVATATSGTDDDYDYSAALKGTSYEATYRKQQQQQSPRKSPPKPEDPRQSKSGSALMEDPLLDLEQLEELHEEAERMKALGNKHMASQEFTRAYNAYSAALQLSPVGPSSHVFLCNRAAALLSLKRYAAAATDARRAIALAPTFGKAHARLGQSLYFLKDYEGAVAAYEEAVRFEPDNTVTQTYLEKARSKLARQHEKARRAARGDEVSVTEDSMAPTVVNSIATDPSRGAAVLQSSSRGNQQALMAAAARHQLPNEVDTGMAPVQPSPLANDGPEGDPEDDPDFDQAVVIQEHANKLLAAKRYKEAIESYSAALFLVPDDPYLSPELHLGRAHALNGSYRHESAKNDALLAIKINPTSEAYSTLAKSLFYMKDYLGAVAAFEDCMDLLPQGESLSMFDQAYLRKAEAAWQDELENNPDDARSMASSKSPIPKLPPPRFVPREKALNEAPSMPSMPKQWPQQSSSSPTALKVGRERNVTFLSEALGIKLNRGNDGIVRVLSVSPETPSSKIARSGTIEPGDVVREAAGVDIRRPITNIMWGDTIALVKIAPRPITMVVARELSEVPPSVLEEREKVQAEEALSPAKQSARRGESKEEEEYALPPSPAVGDESVRDSIAMANEQAAHSRAGAAAATPDEHHVSDTTADSSSAPMEPLPDSTNDTMDLLNRRKSEEVASEDHGLDPLDLAVSSESVSCQEESEVDRGDTCIDVKNDVVNIDETIVQVDSDERLVDDEGEKKGIGDTIENAETTPPLVDEDAANVEERENKDTSSDSTEFSVELNVITERASPSELTRKVLSREEEMEAIGAEILFEKRADQVGADEWSNLRWLATSGERQLRFCKVVTKTKSTWKGLFRSGLPNHVRRKLAIYEKPNIILLLRPPSNVDEVRKLLDLPDGVALEDEKNALHSFLVAESVIDPVTCMLRLSQLTTVTSVRSSPDETAGQRQRSYLELVTPTETVALSALSPEKEKMLMKERPLPGGPAFLQTASLENAIANALYHAHQPHADPNGITDGAWKHQVVQGTLHSFVLSGNNVMLEKAIQAAVTQDSSSGGATKYVPHHIIDAQDETGRTALHYACLRRASHAVSLLTAAGASCSIPLNPGGFYPSHLSALVHDEKSLSVILAATYPSRPDPNHLDALGRTPMYLAAVEGKQPLISDGGAPDSLGRCLSALEAWGGQLLPNDGPIALRHPVSVLASRWAKAEMAAVLAHVPFRYPLEAFASLPGSTNGMSLGALTQYPLHSALVTLRERIRMVGDDVREGYVFIDDRSPESALVGTMRVLLEHGFEANERLEGVVENCEGASDLIEFTGYSPLQILAVAAMDVDALNNSIGAGLKECIAQTIAGAAELLVQCGARLTLDPPPLTRLKRSGSSLSLTSDSDLASEEFRSSLKIDGNKKLVKLLGGEEHLKEAKRHWMHIKPVEATCRVTIQKEASKGPLVDSNAPGGSDENSCAICWKEFGTLMNRKQKCKVSMRYVCDECSSKRIVDGKEEFRVSDGQFCLARVDAARRATDDIVHEKAKAVRSCYEKPSRNVRPAAPLPSDDENRDSLFGTMLDKAASLVLGEEDAADLTGRQVEGLSGKLNQTKDALNERGEKLSSLGEKTSQLADSSREFAKMAKELERSQKGGLFW